MKGTVGICPQCGKASVDFSALTGGEASCRACKWSGAREELVTVPFDHEFLSDDSIVISLMNDLKELLTGQLGLPYLRFLLKWGFLQGSSARAVDTVDRKQFARYLLVIARGILVAILEERARADALEAAPNG
jgi:hypothetical protein